MQNVVLESRKVTLAITYYCFLFTYPAVTEQHDHSFGVVFVSPDECKSITLSLLALILVSTTS